MGKWKCKDGSEIAIKDMTTSHIENALAMLKRDGFVGVGYYLFCLNCPMPNGEMALDVVEREQLNILGSPTSQFVDMFEDELKRRLNNVHHREADNE